MSSPGAHKRYQMERERREREALEQSERTRLKRAAAKHIMALWNAALAAGWRTIFYPAVGTALATGCHWLHVVCPACQQLGETDLRQIDIHPNASLGTVVRRCPASAARRTRHSRGRSERRGGPGKARTGGGESVRPNRFGASRLRTSGGGGGRSPRRRIVKPSRCACLSQHHSDADV